MTKSNPKEMPQKVVKTFPFSNVRRQQKTEEEMSLTLKTKQHGLEISNEFNSHYRRTAFSYF